MSVSVFLSRAKRNHSRSLSFSSASLYPEAQASLSVLIAKSSTSIVFFMSCSHSLNISRSLITFYRWSKAADSICRSLSLILERSSCSLSLSSLTFSWCIESSSDWNSLIILRYFADSSSLILDSSSSQTRLTSDSTSIQTLSSHSHLYFVIHSSKVLKGSSFSDWILSLNT